MARSSLGLWERLPLFTLFAGTALAIGLGVPVVFEWGQEPPARHRMPTLEWAALTILLLTLIACALAVTLGRRRENRMIARNQEFSGGRRTIFVAALAAAAAAAIAWWLGANAAVTAVAFAIAGWSFFQGWGVRVRASALLATLFFPFAWMVAFNEPFGHASGLAVNIPVGPGLYPASLVSSVAGGAGFQELAVIAAAIVVAQLLLGAWLARRGGRPFVAFTILSLVLASLSSMFMHVLYRA